MTTPDQTGDPNQARDLDMAQRQRQEARVRDAHGTAAEQAQEGVDPTAERRPTL